VGDGASVGPAAPAGAAAPLAAATPLEPPAVIGILGGGQLGRMLGLAARRMGYRLRILDPDPDCPAAAVADEVIVGAYDDAAAALRLATASDVVTYELEHVDAAVVERVAERVAVRPGLDVLRACQDRLAERRLLAELGIETAPWREVRAGTDLRAAARDLGFPDRPLRLKAPFGGYDGRSQLRLVDDAELATAAERLGVAPGTDLLLEVELDFAAELSVIVARGVDGRSVAFPPARNRHDDGILVESSVPSGLPAAVEAAARTIAVRLAEALDLVGLLTVECFAMADGRVLVNELAPRVHNSGHWTIEGAATSQFEQQIRAICGLPLGDPAAHGPAAMVNLLGRGPRRPARLTGLAEALADPAVHLHLYAKREVFERRKMGHLTVVGAASVEDALARGRRALAALRWC
jgi:5-(carboxyamino)imidazole ribonucleotide synthase